MTNHFSRSLRTLNAESSRRNHFFLAGVLIFLAIWATWFATARVSVYAATGIARLEVESENHRVDVATSGRVIVAPPAIGERIQAGDLLLELDAISESLAQQEAEARLAPTLSQLTSLKSQRQAEQQALDEERRARDAAISDSRTKIDQARASADLASDEASRLIQLQQNGIVSDVEVLRAKKVAQERASDVRSAEFAARLVARDLQTREQDRLAKIAALNAEIAALEGTRTEAIAASKRLGYEINRRQVRAPISGLLADVLPLKTGAVVNAGDRICTIVPDGRIKVVALFEPSDALGRVRVGQPARVRLEGFPWTQFGSAPARVSNIAGEVRDKKVRVELTLNSPSPSAIPLQHGIPAEVDVEIERISPAVMALRAIGRHMLVSAAQSGR